MTAALVNGREAESLPLFDRGLQFGDGLFETLAVVDGRPALWERHLRRLQKGCRQLGLTMPDPHDLWQEAQRLLQGRSTAILKIILTRGCSERGYAFDPDLPPNRILACFPWSGPTARPLPARHCRQRLGEQPGYAGLKHLNRLEQVLARRECPQGEGLMQDTHGALVSGIASNLFLVFDGRLHTPIIDRCGVAGVVRESILELAHQRRQPVVVRRIAVDELEEAEGLFFTSSLLGVVPIDTLDGRPWAARITHHPLLAEAARRAFTQDG